MLRADPKPATAGYALLASATTALAVVLRSGYSFGLYDQTVYSVRGIALADPGAYAADWFARSVPQPHWLFDVLTYVGTRFGILTSVYLLYWLAGIVIFGLASLWLVDRFVPGRRALSLAVGPLVAIGPTAFLGSTSPLLWFADPHMLGGCLAVLALAAVLTDRWAVAAVAALAAELVHVQHGANLAPVLLVAALLGAAQPRGRRILLAGTAAVLVAAAPLIAAWRGIETGGEEWATTCRDIIPFHCYAPSWSWGYLGSGAAVLALAFLLGWEGRRWWRTALPAVVMPAAGLLFGVVAERYELGVLGRLAQQFNVHRLATFVEPMAVVALLCLAVRVTASHVGHPALRLAGLAAPAGWILLVDGAGHGRVSPGGAIAAALTAVLLGFLLTAPDGRVLREAGSGRLRRPAVAAAGLVGALALLGAPAGAFGHLDYDRSLGRVRTGLALRQALPENAVVAAPPELFWIRSLAQRSVIADCKAVPYGGDPWHEWMARMRALGGPCVNTQSGFRELSPAAVEQLQADYGATHALLFVDDPKLDHARAHWTLVYEAPPPEDGSVRQGLALFELAPLR
jgi:hypothetical protein